MDFLIELILEILGAGVDAALDSKKTPLKAKLAIFSVLCLLFIGASAVASVLFFVKESNALAGGLFAALAALFVVFWIFGAIRLINKNK